MGTMIQNGTLTVTTTHSYTFSASSATWTQNREQDWVAGTLNPDAVNAIQAAIKQHRGNWRFQIEGESDGKSIVATGSGEPSLNGTRITIRVLDIQSHATEVPANGPVVEED